MPGYQLVQFDYQRYVNPKLEILFVNVVTLVAIFQEGYKVVKRATEEGNLVQVLD